MPIGVYDKAKNVRLFEITLAQRDQLIAALQEESARDHDYYIDAAVVDFLDGKVDAELLEKLRLAVGAPPKRDDAELEIAQDGAVDDEAALGAVELPEGIDVEWREE